MTTPETATPVREPAEGGPWTVRSERGGGAEAFRASNAAFTVYATRDAATRFSVVVSRSGEEHGREYCIAAGAGNPPEMVANLAVHARLRDEAGEHPHFNPDGTPHEPVPPDMHAMRIYAALRAIVHAENPDDHAALAAAVVECVEAVGTGPTPYALCGGPDEEGCHLCVRPAGHARGADETCWSPGYGLPAPRDVHRSFVEYARAAASRPSAGEAFVVIPFAAGYGGANPSRERPHPAYAEREAAIRAAVLLSATVCTDDGATRDSEAAIEAKLRATGYYSDGEDGVQILAVRAA